MRVRKELEIRTKILELIHRKDEQPEQFSGPEEEQKWACIDAQIRALRWVVGEEEQLDGGSNE